VLILFASVKKRGGGEKKRAVSHRCPCKSAGFRHRRQQNRIRVRHLLFPDRKREKEEGRASCGIVCLFRYGSPPRPSSCPCKRKRGKKGEEEVSRATRGNAARILALLRSHLRRAEGEKKKDYQQTSSRSIPTRGEPPELLRSLSTEKETKYVAQFPPVPPRLMTPVIVGLDSSRKEKKKRRRKKGLPARRKAVSLVCITAPAPRRSLRLRLLRR